MDGHDGDCRGRGSEEAPLERAWRRAVARRLGKVAHSRLGLEISFSSSFSAPPLTAAGRVSRHARAGEEGREEARAPSRASHRRSGEGSWPCYTLEGAAARALGDHGRRRSRASVPRSRMQSRLRPPLSSSSSLPAEALVVGRWPPPAPRVASPQAPLLAFARCLLSLYNRSKESAAGLRPAAVAAMARSLAPPSPN